ncbi:MAG: hypothetical protein EXR33_11360 [Betaproteobacteria bacterium]|nr:hypothetical protein [Betaproteobacteria bacterium]
MDGEGQLPHAGEPRDSVPVSRWPSACALVAANLLPVYGVLQLKWPVFSLLALFWMEVVMIGFVTVLSMLYAPVSGLFSRIGKLIALLFFCVGYAMPTFLYGFALAAIFSPDSFNALCYGLMGLSSAAPPVERPELATLIGIAILGTGLQLLDAVGSGWFAPAAIVALATSHLLAFFRHYVDRGEFRDARLRVLTFKPFGWLALMHVIVVAGGSAVLYGDSPDWAPLLIIGVKTAVDLIGHLREWSRLHPPLLSAR